MTTDNDAYIDPDVLAMLQLAGVKALWQRQRFQWKLVNIHTLAMVTCPCQMMVTREDWIRAMGEVI